MQMSIIIRILIIINQVNKFLKELLIKPDDPTVDGVKFFIYVPIPPNKVNIIIISNIFMDV